MFPKVIQMCMMSGMHLNMRNKPLTFSAPSQTKFSRETTDLVCKDFYDIRDTGYHALWSHFRALVWVSLALAPKLTLLGVSYPESIERTERAGLGDG